MPSRSHVGASCLGASLLLLAASAPATAAEQRISGKLNKPNYTVIAVGPGNEKAVRAGRGNFALRLPPGEGVSLHLRGPKGSYAGPIVIERRKEGKRAILGVRPGAKLGRIKVRRGFATLADPLPEERVDESRVARARRESRSARACSDGCGRGRRKTPLPVTRTSMASPTSSTSTTTAT